MKYMLQGGGEAALYPAVVEGPKILYEAKGILYQ